LEYKCECGIWSWNELDQFDQEIDMENISYKKVGNFKFF
jgi:hypothetical protein